MFGWLASRSTLCPHATATAVSRRARRITPHLLLDLLPALGSVLYLHATANEALPDDLPQGVLVQRACVPLLGVCWLVAISAVRANGANVSMPGGVRGRDGICCPIPTISPGTP